MNITSSTRRFVPLVLAITSFGCNGQDVYQNGKHPTVTRSSYILHPHKYYCKNDPYSCKECPVGKPDRVVKIAHGPYQEGDPRKGDVPAVINVWFLCDDINRLVPPPGAEDSDTFICRREPADGFVEYEGKKYSCAQSAEGDQKQELGTIEPGESKTVTVPIHVKGAQ